MTDTPVIASACFLTRTLRVESPWSCLACFTELLFFQNHLFAVYLFPSRYVMSASFYLAWVNECGVEAYTLAKCAYLNFDREPPMRTRF
jgi:hypothetical protein